MKIYQATMDDLKGVSELFHLYREFYQQKPDREGARAYIHERLKNKDSIIFAAKENSNYVGFVQLYPIFSSISMKRAWILNDLYIDASKRKKGIGEKLLTKAKEYAIETGASSISLSTAPDNHVAQRLYEKNGYKQDSQFFHYELTLSSK